MYPVTDDVAIWQLAASALPDPVHVPVHCPALTHLPLEHWLSAVHRHAVPAALGAPSEQEYTVLWVGVAGRPGLVGTQLNASTAALVVVHARRPHPDQLLHWPLGHWLLLVHQHGVPPAVHVPLDDATVSQLPFEQE